VSSQQVYPEVDAWVAAIHATAADFRPLGCGLVLDDHRILTCASVIDGTARPWVSFPHATGEARLPVEHVVLPAGRSPVKDLAILVLAEPVPGNVTPAPLRCPEPKSLIARRWWAFGFPHGDPVGGSAFGTVESTGAHGWIRLSTTSRFAVEQGFSGGGLWSPDYQAVVAVVSRDSGDGRAITIHQAIHWLPGQGLRELAEQSRATDSGEQALAAWGWNPPPGHYVYVAEGDLTITGPAPGPQAGRDAYAAGRDMTIIVNGPGSSPPEPGQVTGWTLATDPETRRHWRPRARGVTIDSEKGYRFRGRTAALATMRLWLDRETLDRKTLIVTGNPGSGKSAVLGRIVTTADKEAAAQLPADDTAVRATEGCVACAVHAKGHTTLEIAQQIARAASAAIPDRLEDFAPILRDALTERTNQRFNVVIDALDEAAEPRTTIAKVIIPLAETCADLGAQLVVGSRRKDSDGDLLAAFGGAATIIDLDTEQYFALEDLTAYTHATLQLADDPRPGNPYNDESQSLPLAMRIAQLSHPSFLVAGLTARTHALYDTVAADPARLSFSPKVDDAMRDYLSRIPDVAGVSAEALLLPLAYAESPGLPASLWPVALKALDSGDVSQLALKRFARSTAASFLIESAGEGSDDPQFRLFHQALNEALLRPRAMLVEPREDEQALMRAFMAAGQQPGWGHAAPYLLRSLPAHAARAGMMDELLADAGYCLYGDLLRLQPLAGRAKSVTGQRSARLLRLSPRDVITADATTRVAMFSVIEALEGLGGTYTRASTGAPYRAAWASAPTSSEQSVLRGQDGRLQAICAFTLNRKGLIATAGDTVVRIWDPTTGAIHRTLAGHDGAVLAMCPFTLNGSTHIATAGLDRTVRIWDPATGATHGGLSGSHDPFHEICAFTLNGGTHLAVASNEEIRLWDPAAATHRSTTIHAIAGHRAWINALCPVTLGGSTLIAVAAGDAVYIWDPDAGKTRRTLKGHGARVSSLCTLSLDGTTFLASASEDHSARLWNPATGATKLVLTGHQGPVDAICAVSLNGRPHLATGGNTVRIWDPASGGQVAAFTGPGSNLRVSALCALSSADALIAAARGDTVRILDPATRAQQRASTERRGSVNALATTDPGAAALLAAGGDDGTLRILEPATGTTLRTLTGHNGPIHAICAFSLNDAARLASAGFGGTVRIWDPATGTTLRTLTGHNGPVHAVCSFGLGDAAFLATAGSDHTVQIWDAATGTAHRTLTGHNGRVHAVCSFGLGGTAFLATASSDRTVQVWDPATGIRHRTLSRSTTGHYDRVNALCPVALGGTQFLATAHDDAIACVWGPATGICQRTLAGHGGPVTDVCAFSFGPATLLATASSDCTVRVWDPETGMNLLVVPTRDEALSVAYGAGSLFIGTVTGLLAVRLDPQFLS
jgi:WD40 repeat protein